MTQVYRAGPRRRIVRTGVITDAKPGEPRFGLVLACGHTVPRYLVRIQNRGMAQCRFCAIERELMSKKAGLRP